MLTCAADSDVVTTVHCHNQWSVNSVTCVDEGTPEYSLPDIGVAFWRCVGVFRRYTRESEDSEHKFQKQAAGYTYRILALLFLPVLVYFRELH